MPDVQLCILLGLARGSTPLAARVQAPNGCLIVRGSAPDTPGTGANATAGVPFESGDARSGVGTMIGAGTGRRFPKGLNGVKGVLGVIISAFVSKQSSFARMEPRTETRLRSERWTPKARS